MKIVFTILSAIVPVSCDNHEAVNNNGNNDDLTSSNSYITWQPEEEDVVYYDYYDEEDENIELTSSVTYYTPDGTLII